jgi:type I restriction enzyme S subunit
MADDVHGGTSVAGAWMRRSDLGRVGGDAVSWPLVKLGDICDLQNGYAFKSSDYVEISNTLSCRMSNIRPGGIFDIDYNSRFLPDDFAEKYNQFLLKDDDVVIAMTDLADSPKILGVPTVIETFGRNILLNQRVGKLVIKEASKVYFPYLKLALNYPQVRSIYKKFAGGGLQINLGKSDLLSVVIPLPPLAEQKRIAAILDKADAIRRKRQQAIQLADDFLRAVFLDMFGDPGANPKDFEEAALGDLTSGKTNNGLFRKNDEYGGSVPVAWVGELFRGNRISFSEEAKRIEPTEKEIDAYGLKYGDLLFCRSSLKLEGIGFNNIYLGDNDNALFECHLIRMSPCLEKVNPIFLNYQLRMPSIRARIFQQAKTSTMTTIDQAGLSRIRVTVPPLDLQEEFQRRLLNVEGLYSHLYKSKSLDELAFSSISQKAFQDGL